MLERKKIIDSNRSIGAAENSILRAFFTQEQFTSEDINKAADSLIWAAGQSKPHQTSESPVVIADVLHNWLQREPLFWMDKFKLKSQNQDAFEIEFEDNGETRKIWVEKSDVDYFLNRIRKAIQDRLKTLSQDNIHLTKSPFVFNYSGSNRVRPLLSGHIHKKPREVLDFEADDPPEVIAAQSAAIERLYSLKNRSEFLLYPELTIDPSTRHQIQREIPFLTLKEWAEKKPEPSLKDILKRIDEALRGVIFLYDNNLRLMDLDPSNIGVRLDNNQAILFDYDGLREADFYIDGYLAKREFAPPERRSKRPTLEGPLKEDDAIFELGSTLRIFMNEHPLEAAHLSVDFRLMANKMVGLETPRPSLREVEAALKKEVADQPNGS